VVAFNSDTGPVKPVVGIWQKAHASLRFTERCLSYSIALPSSSICWDLIVRWSRQAFQRLRFDAIDLSFYLRDLPPVLQGERDTDASCANAEPKLSAVTIASRRAGDVHVRYC